MQARSFFRLFQIVCVIGVLLALGTAQLGASGPGTLSIYEFTGKGEKILVDTVPWDGSMVVEFPQGLYVPTTGHVRFAASAKSGLGKPFHDVAVTVHLDGSLERFELEEGPG